LKKNIISISDFGFERACNFVSRWSSIDERTRRRGI
jgi:hypothetical protein